MFNTKCAHVLINKTCVTRVTADVHVVCCVLDVHSNGDSRLCPRFSEVGDVDLDGVKMQPLGVIENVPCWCYLYSFFLDSGGRVPGVGVVGLQAWLCGICFIDSLGMRGCTLPPNRGTCWASRMRCVGLHMSLGP